MSRPPVVLEPPRSKYGAVKVEFAGEIFDSQGELRRWRQLQLLARAGAIKALQRQVDFVLDVPTARGRLRIGTWRADFTYDERTSSGPIVTWHYVVEDFKGIVTPLYAWKKRHVEAQYAISIRETSFRG